MEPLAEIYLVATIVETSWPANKYCPFTVHRGMNCLVSGARQILLNDHMISRLRATGGPYPTELEADVCAMKLDLKRFDIVEQGIRITLLAAVVVVVINIRKGLLKATKADGLLYRYAE